MLPGRISRLQLALLLLGLGGTLAQAAPVKLPSASAPFQLSADCASAESVALAWNEQLLAAIRLDAPRPTVHARNLFHVSAAMYDVWAAAHPEASPVFHDEPTIELAPSELRAAISHAAYRVLVHRFTGSPGASTTLPRLQTCMLQLGLDPGDKGLVGQTPAALGNRVAQTIISFGLSDGSNESGDHVDDGSYFPANAPMLVQLSGTGGMADPNAWQPLIPPGAFGVQSFLTPFWRQVTPFAIVRPGPDQPYLDPGPPPLLGGAGDAALKLAVLELIQASASLDPGLGVIIDRSPSVVGNNSLGADDGSGHPVNPATGQPYPPNPMLLGDFGRVSAEFWADGPASSTPPGHWNEIANAVVQHADFERRLGGRGPMLGRLEWDVKMYLALNGALHDAAIATWETKRQYDSSRPISLIREMGAFGQSSDPDGLAYHPLGLPLEAGLVEVITAISAAPGERHAHLSDHIGEIAVLGWLGHPADPETQIGGVGWLRAVDWWPYQERSFVTPPFGGYTSGHSGFSRAAAEVLAGLSGSTWFPGGLAGYTVAADGPGYSLNFEYGPSAPVELQWATYFDAADEAGQSRIWGGIHPVFDDHSGRIIGSAVGQQALARAFELFGAPAPAMAVPGPGPAGLILLGIGLAGLAGRRLRISCADRRRA